MMLLGPRRPILTTSDDFSVVKKRSDGAEEGSKIADGSGLSGRRLQITDHVYSDITGQCL